MLHRAVRYDDIYRLDEIKSLSFHIMFYRGVAKYIVSGKTFSSFEWLWSLYAAHHGARRRQNEQPGHNEEPVPKRGTTSVAWSRVFKHCSFKQPILSWNSNNSPIYVRRLFLCERSAPFLFYRLWMIT